MWEMELPWAVGRGPSGAYIIGNTKERENKIK
jgi:hypothetical protein